MKITLRRQLRILQAYAALSFAVAAFVSLTAFTQQTSMQRIDELTVQRLNVVDANGTLRFVLSNKDKMHPGVMDGVTINRPRPVAGMLFFNDEGDEVGGLTYTGTDDNGRRANAGIMFDQLKQDQTIGISYSENNGQRSAGLQVWDRSEQPLSDLIRALNDANALPEGPERDAAVKAVRAKAPAGPRRLFVGKNSDKSATVSLADGQGHPRLVLRVKEDGASSIEFLDVDGKITQRFPKPMTLPDDAHVGQVSLTVRDLDRSVPFYRDVLGLTETGNPSEGAASGAIALGAPGGRGLIELHENSNAISKPRRSTGLYHFAILVPSRAALGRSLRRLSEKRYPLTGASDHLVSEALYLDDPDGLGIEIYRDRPRAEWPAPNGQLLMATDPLDLQGVFDEAGAETPWPGLEAGTVIGHVHLHVPHLDTAEQFYCGRIGFEPTVRGYPGALFVAAGGYHHHLGLNTWTGVGAPPPPENAVGLRAFTIESSQLTPSELVDEDTRVRVLLSRTATTEDAEHTET